MSKLFWSWARKTGAHHEDSLYLFCSFLSDIQYGWCEWEYLPISGNMRPVNSNFHFEDSISVWKLCIYHLCTILTQQVTRRRPTCKLLKTDGRTTDWPLFIWIYWSDSNSWIYFYIVLNKDWKIYWSKQSLTGLGPGRLVDEEVFGYFIITL
jgi:hypothetical protein